MSEPIKDYTVIDLEMTGLAVKEDKILEIGAVRVRGGNIIDTYATLVNPGRPVPQKVTELTGITDEMAGSGLQEETAVTDLLDFIGDDVIVGHNVIFDYSFMKQWAVNQRRPLSLRACDTLKLARALLPKEQSKKLDALCSYFHIEREHAHRALDDALETQQIYEHLVRLAAERAPELLEPKELVYKAKRQTPASPHQIKRLMEIRAKHNITDEIDWNHLTRSQASRLQDQYYAAYGR